MTFWYNADAVDTEMPTMKKTISLVSLAVAAAAAAATFENSPIFVKRTAVHRPCVCRTVLDLRRKKEGRRVLRFDAG